MELDSWTRDERTVAWVYGSTLVGAAVVVSAGVVASEPGQVPLYTAATMVVVWLAHSYAAFVGHGGRVHLTGLASRIHSAMSSELPVLASATPTLAALAIAWLAGAGVNTTGWAGLATAIAVMSAVTAREARQSGAGKLGVVAAALTALVVGVLLVAAKVALK